MSKKLHGIEIESRYDSENEIQEMTTLVEALHAKDPALCELIEKLLYDSNSSYCTFEFRSPQPDFDSEEMRSILYLAKYRLVQFEWDAGMEHLGDPNEEV